MDYKQECSTVQHRQYNTVSQYGRQIDCTDSSSRSSDFSPKQQSHNRNQCPCIRRQRRRETRRCFAHNFFTRCAIRHSSCSLCVCVSDQYFVVNAKGMVDLLHGTTKSTLLYYRLMGYDLMMIDTIFEWLRLASTYIKVLSSAWEHAPTATPPRATTGSGTPVCAHGLR